MGDGNCKVIILVCFFCFFCNGCVGGIDMLVSIIVEGRGMGGLRRGKNR